MSVSRLVRRSLKYYFAVKCCAARVIFLLDLTLLQSPDFVSTIIRICDLYRIYIFLRLFDRSGASCFILSVGASQTTANNLPAPIVRGYQVCDIAPTIYAHVY